MSRSYYIVTYIPAGWSEPEEERVVPETGDPGPDVDAILDEVWRRGDEPIHVAWSNGQPLWAADGIDL